MIDPSDRLELWLHYATGTRYRQFSAVKEEYYYLEEAWEDVQKGRMERLSMLSEESRKRLKEAAGDGFMDRYIRWLDKNGVNVVTSSSYLYPTLLAQIPDPPAVLFYKGALNGDLQLPIAVVGTRRCTDYGKEVAKKFGRELVRRAAPWCRASLPGSTAMPRWAPSAWRELRTPPWRCWAAAST